MYSVDGICVLLSCSRNSVLLISQFPTSACCAYVRHVEKRLNTRTANTRQKLKKINRQKAHSTCATIAAENRSHSQHTQWNGHTKIILPWYTTPFARELDHKFMMRGGGVSDAYKTHETLPRTF